jgi:hypothetical protein
MTEAQLRQLWKDEYCNPATPIHTLDKVLVQFREDMFDHVFYESDNRKARDKSILSLNRLEKMLWIKETLLDPSALLKQGWDRDRKRYENSRRVAFIKGSYMVVIRFTGLLKASFVTAYEMQDDISIQKVLDSPDWIKEEKYIGGD